METVRYSLHPLYGASVFAIITTQWMAALHSMSLSPHLINDQSSVLGCLISPTRWACCADSEKIAADRNLPFQRLSSINGGTLLAPLRLPSQINTLCITDSECAAPGLLARRRLNRLVDHIIVAVAYYFMRLIVHTRFINQHPPLAGIEAHRDPCGGGRAQSHTRCTSQEAPSQSALPGRGGRCTFDVPTSGC